MEIRSKDFFRQNATIMDFFYQKISQSTTFTFPHYRLFSHKMIYHRYRGFCFWVNRKSRREYFSEFWIMRFWNVATAHFFAFGEKMTPPTRQNPITQKSQHITLSVPITEKKCPISII